MILKHQEFVAEERFIVGPCKGSRQVACAKKERKKEKTPKTNLKVPEGFEQKHFERPGEGEGFTRYMIRFMLNSLIGWW